MSRLPVVVLALACVTVGHGAHAQTDTARFTCEPGTSQAQRAVTATFEGTDTGSVSAILATDHGTQVRQGTTAQPVSDAECRALVSALTSTERSGLAGTHVVLYRIETSGRQTHAFAAYAALVPSDDPGDAETGWDLIYVLDAGYKVLFTTLAANPDTL